MKQTRRRMLGASLCLGLATLASPSTLVQPGAASHHQPSELVYIGMHGTKITAARFDTRTGALQAAWK